MCWGQFLDDDLWLNCRILRRGSGDRVDECFFRVRVEAIEIGVFFQFFYNIFYIL